MSWQVFSGVNGFGGSISPGGATQVENGANSPTYTETPDQYYHFNYFNVDDYPNANSSLEYDTSYQFVNVTEPHNIYAFFEGNTYTLTMAVTGSGTVSPSEGAHNETYSDGLSLLATPQKDWQFQSWNIGGVTYYANPKYYEMPGENLTVTATFVYRPGGLFHLMG